MAGPLDAVTAIHNAFRADMKLIDDAAYKAAEGSGDLKAVVERYRFFNEILEWHARGEEKAVFPAVDGIAPLVAEAYETDHRGLDALFATLSKAIDTKSALDTARATSAFKFFLDTHLNKEDAHLYRILRENVDAPQQGQIVGLMSQEVHQERFPEVIAWMFPLMGDQDRENMTRIWKMVMPEPAFAGAKGLIQKAIPDGWGELTRRIPELAA